MNHSSKIGLWRNAPPTDRDNSGERFPTEFIFPSGRQALSHALSQAGMSRVKRVACPEWSSHCLLSAVSRYATPVPMKEVLHSGLAVDAVLIYEQWGWPLRTDVWEHLVERFPRVPLIWDRVDSADWLVQTAMPANEIVADITSLSKLLGLPGGGILRGKHGFEVYCKRPLSALTLMLMQTSGNVQDDFEGQEYFKNQGETVHPSAERWLRENSLAIALAGESAARQRNLKALQRTTLTQHWASWMKQAIADGACPGIVPLMSGAEAGAMEKALSRLETAHNITGARYHFNWSGNPLEPDYQPCLAFPVHGQVADIEPILAALQHFIQI